MLVYIDNIHEEHLLDACTNYFLDEISQPAFFAIKAQNLGAVAVLVRRLEAEEEVIVNKEISNNKIQWNKIKLY